MLESAFLLKKIIELTNSNMFFQSTKWLLTEAGKISVSNK